MSFESPMACMTALHYTLESSAYCPVTGDRLARSSCVAHTHCAASLRYGNCCGNLSSAGFFASDCCIYSIIYSRLFTASSQQLNLQQINTATNIINLNRPTRGKNCRSPRLRRRVHLPVNGMIKPATE